MKTMKCPRVDADVRVDITQVNCISVHECFDDDSCPLDGCFSKGKMGNRDSECYDPSDAKCKFGDIA
jgi:hypothetical protein